MTARLPAYLVQGADPVLLADGARALVAELVGDGDAALVVEDVPGESAEEVLPAAVDAASTPPFLTDMRVVVVRDVGRFKTDELGALVEYLADPLPSTSLVLVGGGGQVSARLVTAVKKVGHVVETRPPAKAGPRRQWLDDRLKESSVRLDPDARRVLSDHLGEDVGRLRALLELLEGAYGPGAKIGPEELGPFLGEAGAVAPFALTDAIDRGDTASALAVLGRLLAGRHPLQLLATLHGHYARMLRLEGAGLGSEADAAAALGITGSTFPAKKALEQGRRIGHEGVSRAIALLAAADLDLKGARDLPGEVVLEVLVARLSRISPRAR